MKSASHFEFLIIFQFCLKIFLSFPRCFTFSTQNFTKIGSLLSEIWRCDYFKSRPASWFLKSIYHHSGAEFAFSDQISRKSKFVTTVTIWFSVLNFIEIRLYSTEICLYYDFYVGGRPPYLIYVDVMVLHPVTDFNGRETELNFHVYWFCSSWDTWDIVFQRFGLILPDHAHIWMTHLHEPLSRDWQGGVNIKRTQ